MTIQLTGNIEDIKRRLTAFTSKYYNIYMGDIIFDNGENENSILMIPSLDIRYSTAFPYYVFSVNPITKCLRIHHLFRENPRNSDCPSASIFIACCLNLAMTSITEIQKIIFNGVIEQDTSEYFKNILTKISVSSSWRGGSDTARYPHTIDTTYITHDIDKDEFLHITPLGKFTNKLIKTLSFNRVSRVSIKIPKRYMTRVRGKLGGAATSISNRGREVENSLPSRELGLHVSAYRLNEAGVDIHVQLSP